MFLSSAVIEAYNILQLCMSDKTKESGSVLGRMSRQPPSHQAMVPPAMEIDASGLACPLPLLRAKQGLNQLQQGQILKLIATDPGSVRDFHSFADLTSHRLLQFSECDNVFTYYLQKGDS